MTHPHLHRLFASDLLRVEVYDCPGGSPVREPEECAERPEIVFQRVGAFVRHDAAGPLVADPNQVVFFQARRPYQISHPVPGVDRSTIFSLAPPVLIELVKDFHPAAADHPDQPFPASQVLAGMRQRLRHHHLLQALAGPDRPDPAQIEEQALRLLADVLAGAASERPRRPETRRARSAQREAVDQARLVLGERFRDRLSVGDVARAAHLSPYHLCRVFRRETGLTLHGYLQRLRLLGALEHLAQQPQTELTRVAVDFGFASPSHFSAAFRQAFGLPPSAVRRRPWRELSTILKA